MSSPITTDNRPIVGAYGDVYTAPAGTAVPTDPNAPATPWLKLGLVSEDGATWTPPAEEQTDIKAWQSPYPVRIVTTSLTTSVQFALMEWDRDTLPFALGGGSFVEDTPVGFVTYKPPGPGESESRALLVKVLDTPVKLWLYYPQGRITDRGDTIFKPDEAALLDLTFGIEGQVGVDPFQLIFDSAAFPDATVLLAGEGSEEDAPGETVSATAGTPGTYYPPTAVPADLAALSGVLADPTTPWVGGSYLILGDATYAHWDGTAWVAGTAP